MVCCDQIHFIIVMKFVCLEPSSVLADRVMHALDNPSPPPSPSLPLSFFDPYHATTPQSPTDYQNDLFSLGVNNRSERDGDNPLLLSVTNSKAQTFDSHLNSPSQVIQQHLISFDSVPIEPSKEANSSLLLKESIPINDCPIPVNLPPLENLLLESVAPVDLAQTVNVGEDSDMLHNSEPQTGLDVGHVLPQQSIVETPVRRSSRPRMSVIVNPVPPPTLLPPSGAHTHIKEKLPESPTAPSTVPARQRSPARLPMSFNRVLGSLSPKSTDLLSKLALTSTEERNDIRIGIGEPSSDSQSQFTFSMFPTLPESVPPQTPSRPTGPIRFSSPTRPTSPHKIRLQAVVPNNPMNTPARRIPIEQGITQGHVSPQKAARLGFKPDGMLLTSVQTPARRVLISEHSANPVTRPGGIRLGSPWKGKERELSVEPSSRPLVSRRNEREKTPGPSSTETLAKPSTVQTEKLPFPLVPSNSAPSISSATVPENSQCNLPQEKPVNAKSSLRQLTSKIPRIGIKPYTRPLALKSTEKDSSTPRERKVDPSVSLVDCWYNTYILTSFPKSPQKSTTMESTSVPPRDSKGTTSPISRVKPTISTSTSLLKRKGEVEKPSPVKPRFISLRQVPKVVLSSSASSKIRFGPPTGLKTSRNLRSVRNSESSKVMKSPERKESSPPLRTCSPMVEDRQSSPPPHTGSPMVEDRQSSPPPRTGSPMVEDPPSHPHEVLKLQSEPPESIVHDKTPTSDKSSLRRTTRSRRTAVTGGSSRPRPTRRKPASSRMDDVFSGMSITALKDLTTSNTARNQQYLFAKLEREVIRKEGVRPESPVVKFVQREMDVKMKERAERAIRRARRSSGDMISSDIEGCSDVGYSSPCEDRSGESNHKPLTKHRRGPGDESDYETPERLDRHKKAKLFVEADDQDGEPERRVKWDRGLFTSVYLDEVKLGTRQPLKENRSLKGILAPTAKVCYSDLSVLLAQSKTGSVQAVQLDTLGNLPQADLPLTDLVQENITIKKYVYEDEDEPVSELLVVKNTRSRAKKSKS